MNKELREYEYSENVRTVERSEIQKAFTGSYGYLDRDSISGSGLVVDRTEFGEVVIRFTGDGRLDIGRRSTDPKHYSNYERRN